MRNRWFKRLFPVIALLLLAPWPIAYAYAGTDNAGAQNIVQIQPAEDSVSPTWTVFQRTPGSVTPGDLFYIDATKNTADIKVTLYLTNAGELAQHYRYLILKIGVYVQGGAGEWQKASASNGELVPDTIISLRDAEAAFTLPGYASYKLTIDSGNFYSPSLKGIASSYAPNFFVTAD